MRISNLFILAVFCYILSGCTLFRHEINYSAYTSEELNDFGVVYERAGNTDKAKLFFSKAVEKSPENHVAMTNLGNIYYQESQLQQAAQLYESVLNLEPEYVPAINNLANIQIKTGKLDKAEKNLKKALLYSESGENTKAICQSLGTLFKRKGNPAEAEKWLKKADSIKNKIVLEDVPFFRQAGSECGPAALACVYNFYGAKQSQEVISQRVYDEKQKGSLNLKMLIDARDQGFEAILYSGSFEDIRSSVDKGIPLILMIASGFSDYHYIVVTGYEGENASSLIAHDGRKAFAKYNRNEIQGLWKSTGFCTISVTKPNYSFSDN
ncbi:MAG: tetratricopeptide repeat protein [Desulfobacterales bacterium]|nr:tetratricopeptide repeat protein [Desulfobacterales bacterium]